MPLSLRLVLWHLSGLESVHMASWQWQGPGMARRGKRSCGGLQFLLAPLARERGKPTQGNLRDSPCIEAHSLESALPRRLWHKPVGCVIGREYRGE